MTQKFKSKVNSEDAKRLASEYAELAIRTLADICLDDQAAASARATAAAQLLDRAFGRPAQAMELSGPDGRAIPMAGVDLTKLTTGQLEALKSILDAARETPKLSTTNT